MNADIDFSLTQDLKAASTRELMADALFAFMQRCGQSYYDESVTQLEHALQAARLARQDGGTAEQITAALLHDIGHFLMDEHSQSGTFLTEDWYHEAVGAKQLAPFFAPAVTEPIRLHVPAKRYLCTIDTDYFDGLSRASQRSYQLQGGPMSQNELGDFESNRFYETAVKLRRWDDQAKVTALEVADLEGYRAEVESCFQCDMPL